jgi:hypothetical protein
MGIFHYLDPHEIRPFLVHFTRSCITEGGNESGICVQQHQGSFLARFVLERQITFNKPIEEVVQVLRANRVRGGCSPQKDDPS